MCDFDLDEMTLKMPRNKREALLFQIILSFISVNIIVPIIIMQNSYFSWHNYFMILHLISMMWLAVFTSLFLISKPADFIRNKLTKTSDSFNAQITINIFSRVLLISAIMTILSVWIRDWTIELTPFTNFLTNWPHNFGIAFAVQLFISHPIARQIIIFKHQRLS